MYIYICVYWEKARQRNKLLQAYEYFRESNFIAFIPTLACVSMQLFALWLYLKLNAHRYIVPLRRFQIWSGSAQHPSIFIYQRSSKHWHTKWLDITFSLYYVSALFDYNSLFLYQKLEISLMLVSTSPLQQNKITRTVPRFSSVTQLDDKLVRYYLAVYQPGGYNIKTLILERSNKYIILSLMKRKIYILLLKTIKLFVSRHT